MSFAARKIVLTIYSLSLAGSCCVAQDQQPEPAKRPPAATLSQPKGGAQAVDVRGFIYRWLVLEPVPVSGRLTQSAVEEEKARAEAKKADADAQKRVEPRA